MFKSIPTLKHVDSTNLLCPTRVYGNLEGRPISPRLELPPAAKLTSEKIQWLFTNYWSEILSSVITVCLLVAEIKAAPITAFLWLATGIPLGIYFSGQQEQQKLDNIKAIKEKLSSEPDPALTEENKRKLTAELKEVTESLKVCHEADHRSNIAMLVISLFVAKRGYLFSKTNFIDKWIVPFIFPAASLQGLSSIGQSIFNIGHQAKLSKII